MKWNASRKPQTLSFSAGGCVDSFHKLKKACKSSLIESMWQVPLLNLGLTQTLKDPFHRYDMSARPLLRSRSFLAAGLLPTMSVRA